MQNFCLKPTKLQNKLPVQVQIYNTNVEKEFNESNVASDDDDKQYKGRLLFNEVTHVEDDCLITKVNSIIDINKLSTLILSNCGLVNIPDCFESLRISTLDLSRNNLKEVPACLITGLRRIEELNVSYNFLSDFNFELQCIKCIRIINLEHNNIMDCPLWMFSSKCTNLKTFLYSDNLLNNKFLMQEISNKLETLRLSNCNLSQNKLNFFKMFPYLKSLCLGNYKETCNYINYFENFDVLFYKPMWRHTISTLNLQYLNITSLPEELGSLSNLKELNISWNKLVWLPESLTKLKTLEILNITGNMITSLPYDLYQLNLKSLIAAHNSIISIAKLSKNLILLDLYSNCIDSMASCDLNDVKYLDVEQNYYLEDCINYHNKKDNLRYIIHVNDRIDGVKLESSDDSSSELDSHSSLSDICHEIILDNCSVITESEVWESQIWTRMNEEITLSDDDWTGTSQKLKRAVKTMPCLINESYYYCDAD